MLLVVASGPGTVELAYTWLPSWIAMNTNLLRELEKDVAPVLLNKDLTDATLLEAHDAVLDFFEKKFPALTGLRDYLDSIKFVHPE